jgi:hypothetical protein
MGDSSATESDEHPVRVDGGTEPATDGSVVGAGADGIEYGMDNKPPIERSILLGFQHYLTMIVASIAQVAIGCLGLFGRLKRFLS